MEFNELNRLNLNLPLTPQKGSGVKKGAEKKSEKNIPVEKSPANPVYWQGAVGVKKTSIPANNANLIHSIANIKSDVQIQISETETSTVSEYINFLLSQPAGFKTDEEYKKYVLESFTKNLEDMKTAFEVQEEKDGVITKGYNALKEFSSFGISDEDAKKMIEEQEAMINALQDAMSGKGELSFEQVYEQYTGVAYSKEKIDKNMEMSNIYSAMMAGLQYDDDFSEKFKEATGQKIKDITKEYAQSQLDTFGNATEIKKLSEKYLQDKAGFKDKLSSIVAISGMGCIVAGAITSFAFPALAPVGISLMTMGKSISLGGMFVDNALDVVDKTTDKDGLTKNEIGNIVLETGVEAVSYGVGRKIGGLTNKLNANITSKSIEKGTSEIVSRVVGQTAETTVDTTLSLGADYAIAQGQSLITTGEFMDSKDYWSMERFLGEGKNQLIGILTGMASVKINAYQQGIITTAQGKILNGDIEGAKNHIKQSGMKMNDASFESFVEQVREVDAQVKKANIQTDEPSIDNETIEPENSDTVNTVQCESDKNTSRDIKKIGLQFFAEPKKVDTKQKLSESGFGEFVDYEVARDLTSAQVDIAVKLRDIGFTDYEALSVTKELSLEQADVVVQLKQGGFDNYTSLDASKDLTQEQAIVAVKLKENGLNDFRAIDGAKTLTIEEVEIVSQLKKSGFEEHLILELANQMTLEQTEIAAKLKRNGFDDSRIIELSQIYTPEQVDVAIQLRRSGMSEYDSTRYAMSFTPEQIDVVVKLKDVGFDDYNIINHANTISMKQAEVAIELKMFGFDEYSAIDGAKTLSDGQIEIAVKLKKQGFDDYSSVQGAKILAANEIELATKIKKQGLDDKSAIEGAKYKLSNEQIKVAVNLKQEVEKNGYDIDDSDVIEFARLNPEQLNIARALMPQAEYDESQLSGKTIAILSRFGNYEDSQLKLEEQKSKVLKHPQQYINGEYETDAEMEAEVNEFFASHGDLIQFASIYDKETLDVFFRKRFEEVDEYNREVLSSFSVDDFILLKGLSSTPDENGKPYSPTQKIEFIDLINAYKQSNLDCTKMYDMIQAGKVNVNELNIDLFNQIMKKLNFTDEEIASIPPEKLISWDTKYIHLLAKEINSDSEQTFIDIIRAANSPDFNTYIHNISNIYGKSNAITRAIFEQKGLDYEKWLRPSKQNEVKFISTDKNVEQINQIASQIEEDMSTIMQTPAKGFVKKQFPEFVKNDNFVIPQEFKTKTKLTELAQKLSDTSSNGQLSSIWLRAEQNKNNTQKSEMAKKTLTILDHLNQRMNTISSVSDAHKSKMLDLTIKMWDRVPQKDMFQGNYSTCCIGMGKGNGNAMPHFLLNTSYNMIEMVDNTTGKPVGNALCYFIAGEDGTPSFIIDNIEINDSVKPSDEIGVQLRNSIVQYAQNLTKEVTGKVDTPIYMSGAYNDVPTAHLSQAQKTMSFLGDIACDEIYMDLYDGWVDKSDLTSELSLLKLCQTFFNDKLSHDVNEQLSIRANELNRIYSEHIDEVVQETKQRFSNLESVTPEHITGRAKSAKSTFEKIASRTISGKLTSTDIDDCSRIIADAYGTRIRMNNLSEDVAKSEIATVLKGTGYTAEQFIKFVQGDETSFDDETLQNLRSLKDSVLDALKIKQSDAVVERLVSLIENANPDEPRIITEINNYGDEISSYFTKTQLQKIAKAYFKKYKKPLDIVTKLDVTNLTEGEYEISTVKKDDKVVKIIKIKRENANYTDKNAEKTTGYASGQMNTEHKLSNNTVGKGELQVRGILVNEFADVEHIVYDIKQNKIKADNPKYAQIHKLITSMDDATFEDYSKYLKQVYNNLRLTELGIPTEEPSIDTYLGKYGFSETQLGMLNRHGLSKFH